MQAQQGLRTTELPTWLQAAPGDGDSSVLHSSWALDKVEVLNKSTGIKVGGESDLQEGTVTWWSLAP
jgi:hypothetical protein